MIPRRTFLATVTGGLLIAPLAAAAQQAGKVPRIGMLRFGPPPPSFIEPFRQGLRELGYVEGQSLIIEYGLARSVAQLPDVAAELVRLKVDVLVASGTPSVLVCPLCKGVGSFDITSSIELPPDPWWDELTLQLVECSACQFRGVAVYRESRRGALDRESVDHSCFRVEDAERARVSAMIRECASPADRRCPCRSHTFLAGTSSSSSWEPPVQKVGEEVYPIEWAGEN